MKIPPFTYIILAVALRAANQTIFKKLAIASDHTIFTIVTNELFYIALLVLGARAFMWQKALQNYRLSFAYPFSGIVLILVMINGALFLMKKYRSPIFLGPPSS